MKSITLIQIDTEGNMSTLVINGNSVGFFSLLDQPKYLYITYIDYNFIKLVDKIAYVFNYLKENQDPKDNIYHSKFNNNSLLKLIFFLERCSFCIAVKQLRLQIISLNLIIVMPEE